MRQVPANSQAQALAVAHYLVIGDGRLARHLGTYLSLESVSFDRWSRREPLGALPALISGATNVLLAISDSSIEPFVTAHPSLLDRSCVHFSGALVSAQIPSAHPLMTFSSEPYCLESYRSIPFVFERGRGSMASLLPGLRNSSFEIEAAKKPLYHALCSMSGNFTVMLWEKVFSLFASELHLPPEVLHPYLEQVTKNLLTLKLGESVLTGPLARRDFATIEKHLRALGSDPYSTVYRAFVEAYLKPQSAEHTVLTPGGAV